LAGSSTLPSSSLFFPAGAPPDHVQRVVDMILGLAIFDGLLASNQTIPVRTLLTERKPFNLERDDHES
jgi:hypothetical protein